MPYHRLEIPPGVYKNGTEYQGQGRWTDCDMMRWHEGTMGPMGAAVLEYDFAPNTSDPGIARSLFAWRDNGGLRWTAVGTQDKLYAYRSGSASDITPAGFTGGRTDTVYGLGYGIGPYGAGKYGTPRAGSTTTLEASTWSMSAFGEYLMAVATEDGKLYYWEPEAAQASLVSTAPTVNTGVIVSPERHVILYGADGDPRKVQWSSRETYDVWDPQATNTAGDLIIQSSGKLRTARTVKGQVLLLTDVDAHVLNYLGGTLVYGIEPVGENCGVLSPNAVVAVDSFAAWMSDNGFYLYDGYVKPVPSDVWDDVFQNLNRLQGVKVCAVHEPNYGELTWYYPSANSNENDRFARWNYRESHWAVGSIAYSAAVPRGVVPQPLAFRVSDRTLQALEVGFDHGVAPFAQSGPFELGNGDFVMHATKLIPDADTIGDVRVAFDARLQPAGPATAHGPYTLAPDTDVRFTGRQVAMRVSGAVNTGWRWGRPRLAVKPRSKR